VPTGLLADPALRGDLSQGSVVVELATAANTVTTNPALAKGYQVTYTLNGTAYKGFIAGNGTAGNLGVAAAATLALSSGDNAKNSVITFTTNTQFGASLTATVDQSANIKSAIEANLKGATALNTNKAATVLGEAAQAGIGSVSVTSAPTKNDITFVGDLSTGVFGVSGSAGSGYSISYAINGSTYQGNLSAAQVADGGTLVLDNGSGQLAFAITGGSANTLTSTAFQTALTNQFAAATSSAVRLVSSTLQSNGLGGTIPGSAITAASTNGTIISGFTGANVRLTTAQYGGNATNLPPISNFSATGTGTSTVFSVLIGSTTYSTQGTVATGTTVTGSSFDGATGILNFYKNGDKAGQTGEVLRLDLSAISTGARIDTASAVANFTAALNTAFGSGGATGSGGLTFQLGSDSGSNVTVNIGSAKTVALFAGQSLDISTQSGSTAAATQVGTAINTVTSLRAGVGALQSQFGFAAAALQSSVQNQDAARGQFLDTDIALESTSYATSQVKLQAGISVLAQANQSLQAHLKLIQ
jgi:flagellin